MRINKASGVASSSSGIQQRSTDMETRSVRTDPNDPSTSTTGKKPRRRLIISDDEESDDDAMVEEKEEVPWSPQPCCFDWITHGRRTMVGIPRRSSPKIKINQDALPPKKRFRLTRLVKGGPSGTATNRESEKDPKGGASGSGGPSRAPEKDSKKSRIGDITLGIRQMCFKRKGSRH